MSLARQIKVLLKQAIRQTLDFELFRIADRYSQDGLFTSHNASFRESPAFREAYNRGIKASNGVDPAFEWRVHIALWAARTCLSVPGDFVECGVNAGFMSSAIMQHLDWNNTGRQFFLVDTWEGPPLAQYSEEEIAGGRVDIAREAIGAGAYVTDFERVKRNFAEWPAAILVRGRVPEVLPQLQADEIAFLHIDMNAAAPEREALTFLWPRIGRAGMVLLDDYAFAGYEQQKLAMDTVAAALGTHILSLPTGQGLIIK